MTADGIIDYNQREWTVDYMNEVLHSFFSSKGRIKHSNSTARFFYDNWLKLALTEGFTKEAEHYLYLGIILKSARALKDYILQANKPNEALNVFFNGEMYNKNADTTFRLVSHLTALCLNESRDAQLIARLIEKFPDSYLSKDGARIKSAAKIMEKNFFETLKPSTELVPLSELKLEPNALKRFVKMMRSIIADIEKDKTLDRKNVDKVKAWLATATLIETPSVEDTASIPLSKILERAATMSRALEKNLEEKNQQLEQKTQQLDRLNETLAGKEQMIDLLQREQSRKAEIALNVIAEQLRSEYQDFRTALDLPMDVDLGENMRLQLKKLFTILERNGVNFD